jgi:hypothetical protein
MEAVREYVRKLPPDTIVVSGAGDEERKRKPREIWGVDHHAEDEAIARGLVVVSYPAMWIRTNGTVDRGAGFARNGLIAAQADLVVAFWDGKSRGTKDTIDKARKMRRPVEVMIWVPGVGLVVGV